MQKLLHPILTGLFVLLAVSAGYSQTYFTATLAGNQENPAVATDARGTGVFLLTEEGLKFNITVEGLEISAAHFHHAPTGVNGGVARGLGGDFQGNTAAGTWTGSDAQPLTDDLIKELLAGNIYVNVHTADNPGGEIRGQVLPSSGTAFTAKLTGEQENPAVDTEAKGAGVFTLTKAGLIFSVTVEGLNMTAAHFHRAPIGTNGGVVRDIGGDFDGNTAFGIWTSADGQPLTDELIKDLLLGNLYVNVHTADNPGGEIRGQVLLNSGIGFSANLAGDQENPAVVTDATGTGSFTLTDAGLVFSITVEGLDMTAAHFHNAAAGSNGGVVRGLGADFNGNTAIGVWRDTDDQPLTPEMIAELLKGNIYVNVHTAANPGGEIRGQVNLRSGTGFTARLSGSQQNPAVTTSASGTGTFELTEAGLAFDITVNGLDMTAAHFHNNVIGANGGVVRGLDSEFGAGNTASGIWASTDGQPLTGDLIKALLAGNLYVNVHTAGNPGGEIRGQVLPSSGTGFSAKLTGDQENPAVATAARGTGAFVLTGGGLAFSVTVEGLDFTAAHFHNNAIGANGGVVRDIGGDFVGNTASGIWTSADAQPLTDELIRALLLGNLYVNVHTAANPGGEIRGQVLLNSGTGFSANLMGAQEVPPVNTAAAGTGAFTLTDAGLVFNVTVEGLDMTNAHFHNAPIGENGGVVRGIAADFDGQTASGIWTGADAQALTAELMAEVMLGNIYVNVHTADNPGGEIRGQLSAFDITTSLEPIDGSLNTTDGYTLLQNVPNPFAAHTDILFELSRPGHTVLRVCNMVGKEIATLVDDTLPAGVYRVNFEPRNLPAGVYVYRLGFDGRASARTMILR
ncbi:MAG: CHRD domain-containing protein [Lewinellaceae bacterium]|nr:CHRD domain-containing protein [Lewinellaceae bacterium]